jgi:hypothetical protein
VAGVAALRADAAQPRAVATSAAIAIVISVVGIIALYRQLRYPTQSWYYLGIVAIAAVCAESAVRAAVRPRALTAAIAVAVAALGLTAGAAAWAAMHERQTNLDAIAARLDAEAGPGDVVLTCPWYMGVTLSRYYSGPATTMTVPPVGDHTIARYDLLKQQMLAADAMQPLRAAIDRALSSGHRVWIVGGFIRPPNGVGVPASLPPPPLPVSGWNSVPYEVMWSGQLAAQLRSRAAACSTIDLGAAGGRLEDASLIVCSGWKGI